MRVDRADAYVSAPNPVTTDWSALRTLLVTPPSGEALAGSVSSETKNLMHGGRVAAGLRPSVSVMLRSTGTVPLLAQSAVLVGYKVGGYVNRWLGISAAILGTTNDLKTFSGCSIWVDRWTFFPAGTDGWGPDRYQARFTQNCGGSIAVGQPIWDVPSNPVHQARVAAVDALFADKFPLGAKHDFGIWFNYYIPAVSVETSAKVVADEPLTTQWYTASATAAMVNAILGNINNDPGSTSATADNVRAALLSGPDAADLEIGKLVHPDWEGGPFSWLSPTSGETYAAYETRLRTAGWLGVATVLTLASNNGDSEVAPGNVACTSTPGGATIGVLTPVTIYKNPTVLGNGAPESGAPACPGRLSTTKYLKKCTFGDIQWAVKILGNEAFYTSECEAAWQTFWSTQTWLDETTGLIIAPGQVDTIVEPGDIEDSVVIDYLGAFDPNMANWEKASSPQYDSNGHEFEIHFYRHIPTDTVRFDIDWKLRFTTTFSP